MTWTLQRNYLFIFERAMHRFPSAHSMHIAPFTESPNRLTANESIDNVELHTIYNGKVQIIYYLWLKIHLTIRCANECVFSQLMWQHYQWQWEYFCFFSYLRISITTKMWWVNWWWLTMWVAVTNEGTFSEFSIRSCVIVVAVIWRVGFVVMAWVDNSHSPLFYIVCHQK